MEVNNPLYKNQGIHVISSIFTVDHGDVKVLLIKRTNEPFKDSWALVGGALHNDEDLIDGLNREIKEKCGLENIKNYLVDVYGEVNRSPVMRMVAISYIGIIDYTIVNIKKNTLKTSDAEFFCLNDALKLNLAYDHRIIIEDAFKKLKEFILTTNILSGLFPGDFSMPELQKVYETILNEKLDRRNFRRKILTLVEDTGKSINFEGKKKAKLYRFK